MIWRSGWNIENTRSQQQSHKKDTEVRYVENGSPLVTGDIVKSNPQNSFAFIQWIEMFDLDWPTLQSYLWYKSSCF